MRLHRRRWCKFQARKGLTSVPLPILLVSDHPAAYYRGTPQKKRRHSRRLRPAGCAAIPLLQLATRKFAKRQGIGERLADQPEFDEKYIAFRKRNCISGEHRGSARYEHHQPDDRERRQCVRHRLERQPPPETRDPDIDRHDTAGKQRKPEQMGDIGKRICPGGRSYRLPESRRRDLRCQPLQSQDQRSSTVLSPTMTRSIRISAVPSRRG